MQVSAMHVCGCVWVCVCVFVSVHAPFPHPVPRITLSTSTSLWWVYQIGISCHLGSRTHTVNNTLRFKYPSGSDTDPRLPLQSYQHSIISSQNFINTRQQSLMCLDDVFEPGRDESSPSPELIRSDIGSAVGQTVKMSDMWYRSVVQLVGGGGVKAGCGRLNPD